MGASLIFISGASGGIGTALSRTVPWSDARILGISRHPAEGVEHVEADLSDPSSWRAVGEAFRRELSGFDGECVVFVHAAGTVEPMGFAGEVDTDAYITNVVLNSAAPQLRETSEDEFPNRQKFVDVHAEDKLADPEAVARDIWALLDRDVENGSVVDLRELAKR